MENVVTLTMNPAIKVDSMVAGIVLALVQGMTIQDAAFFGVAAGTAAVMTPGTELCRREDTERLFQEMNLNH